MPGNTYASLVMRHPGKESVHWRIPRVMRYPMKWDFAESDPFLIGATHGHVDQRRMDLAGNPNSFRYGVR